MYDIIINSEFNVNASSYDGINFQINSQDTIPLSIVFNRAYSKLLMIGQNTGKIYQYAINSIYSIDTSSYDGINFQINSQDSAPFGITFNNNYNKMLMAGQNTGKIYQYTINDSSDISVSSYDGISFSVHAQDGYPSGMAFCSNYYKLLMIGLTGKIYQYSVGRNVVSIDMEYDYSEDDYKIEDRHRSSVGNEFIYKWSNTRRRSASLKYVSSSDKYTINNLWKNNIEVIVRNQSNITDVFSCHIINKSLPIGKPIKPYTNMFMGTIELETY